MPALSDVAEVKLGFKSFLNDFFYVDDETIRHFGIEDEFLVPIHMLADLDDTSYRQALTPVRWLFSCRADPADLRGTGAWRYIQWGAQQRTERRSQSKATVLWPDAPALKGAKHWYWPAAPVHPARIAVRKGIGDRYAPFVLDEARVLDQRLYLLFPQPRVDERVLAGYLASSLWPLALETHAEMGLGGGVLTLGTDQLRQLPVLDLERLSLPPTVDLIRGAAETLFDAKVPDASDYPTRRDIRELDEIILKAIGADPASAGELAHQVAELHAARVDKSRLRRVVRRAAHQADLGAVAQPVVRELEEWLSPRRFPEHYVADAPVVQLQLPSTLSVVETEILLGQCSLRILDKEGKTVYEATHNRYTAEIIVRTLLMGRRHFPVPVEEAGALAVLDRFDEWLEGFERQLSSSLGRISLGYRYEEAVRNLVLRRLSIRVDELWRPFESAAWHLA